MQKIQIRQIFYDSESFRLLTPSYIPLDNKNGDKTWFEFWPILNFLKDNELEENVFYGFFSPRFYEKTGFTSEFTYQSISENFDKDAILFSPGWDQLCFYQNPWEQGETHHPGIIKATQCFLDHVKIPINISTLVTTRSTSVFSNFIVAKASYWRRWEFLASRFFQYCKDPTSEIQALTTKHRDGSAPMKVFIQERFSALVLADKTLTTAVFESPKSLIWQESHQELLRCDELKELILQSSPQKDLLEEWMALRRTVLEKAVLKHQKQIS